MKLIVGLGNPGDKYQHTRHNIGFIYLDNLVAQKNLQWSFEKKFNAYLVKDLDIVYLKPQTYMNNSGDSVAKVLSYFDIFPVEMHVVHDEIDFSVGQFKHEFGRGSAGHNGVEDIINRIASKEFWRLRIGVGRPLDERQEIHDFVLGEADKELLDFAKSIEVF